MLQVSQKSFDAFWFFIDILILSLNYINSSFQKAWNNKKIRPKEWKIIKSFEYFN